MTTGLLLRVALRRQLSRLQWLALLLLMAGAATSQINTDCSKGTVQSVLHAPVMVRTLRGIGSRGCSCCTLVNGVESGSCGWLLPPCASASGHRTHACTLQHPAAWHDSRPQTWHAIHSPLLPAATPARHPACHSLPSVASHASPTQGYIYGCVSALLSAVAAVYTEWVLKKNNDTLYWQNMLLYGFGAAFNFLNLAHRWGRAAGMGGLQGWDGVGAAWSCCLGREAAAAGGALLAGAAEALVTRRQTAPTPATCCHSPAHKPPTRARPAHPLALCAARRGRGAAGTCLRATTASPGWWWPTWLSGALAWLACFLACLFLWMLARPPRCCCGAGCCAHQ